MKNKRCGRFGWFGILILSMGCFSLLLGGCAHPFPHAKYSRNASVVDFLFPDGTVEVEQSFVPVLNLPLDVGIAFVPASKDFRNRGQELSEERKTRLLRAMASEFEEYRFVRRIETIPSSYLRAGGGFENLNQVARMFGVQVIALVSYDQMQFTNQDLMSLAYWTVVGAYLVEGERNDTQTMLDAVVYDVHSRALLFRAPGVSRVKARSTVVNQSEELREDADQGFQEAAANLAKNLETELAAFQERIRKNPEEVKLVTRPGYTGGGAFGLFETIVLLGLGMASWTGKRGSRK